MSERIHGASRATALRPILSALILLASTANILAQTGKWSVVGKSSGTVIGREECSFA